MITPTVITKNGTAIPRPSAPDRDEREVLIRFLRDNGRMGWDHQARRLLVDLTAKAMEGAA